MQCPTEVHRVAGVRVLDVVGARSKRIRWRCGAEVERPQVIRRIGRLISIVVRAGHVLNPIELIKSLVVNSQSVSVALPVLEWAINTPPRFALRGEEQTSPQLGGQS